MNNKNEREILPSNKEAEKVVIGSMILSDSALYKVLSILNSEDFYLGKHQIIYKALLNLNDKHISADTITLVDELLLMNELDNVRVYYEFFEKHKNKFIRG